MHDLRIRWATSGDDPGLLAKFFIENVSPEYISQGELQDGRASDIDSWSTELHSIMLRQFKAACGGGGDGTHLETRLAIANDHAMRLMAIGYVGIERSSSIPYAVLHDLVVQSTTRGMGVGSALLEWIEEQLRIQRIKSIFLESGMRNASARAFFESVGYGAVSVNYMKVI